MVRSALAAFLGAGNYWGLLVEQAGLPITPSFSIHVLSHLGGLCRGIAGRKLEDVVAFACLPTMSPRTSSGVIVIVEDPFIRRFVRSVLGRLGHRVMESDAPDACKLAAEAPGSVKLLITNKPDAFEHLEQTLPILYLASTPDWEMASRFSNLRVLQKPFHAHELLEAVGAVTGASVE